MLVERIVRRRVVFLRDIDTSTELGLSVAFQGVLQTEFVEGFSR